MFKFQTTTLLNGASVATLALTADAKNANLMISNAWRSEDYGNAKIVANKESGKEYLAIERLGKFVKSNVTKVYHRAANPGVAGKVEITVALDNTINSYKTTGAGENKGIYRLNLYVRLGEGSQNSNFANVWVFKGKPLAYEFELKSNTGTAADVATGLVNAINHENARFGSKHVKATANGAKITIEAIGPDKFYQYFTVAEIQKFDASVDSALVGGEYVTIASTVVNTMCEYPFGTYNEILKDLRLPTPEHTGWSVIQKDEMPVLGETYDQFMIYMCVNRGIMGGDAVGEATKSVTAHSIWVPTAAASAFSALLTTYVGAPEEYNAEYEAAKGTDTIAGTADDAPGVATEPDVTE